MKNITKEQYEKARHDYESYSLALNRARKKEEEIKEKILFCEEVMDYALEVIRAYETQGKEDEGK